MMAEQMMQHKADKMAAKQTIPAGYKQTEVGLIPDDWHIYSLRELANFGGGTTPPRAQYEKYYQCGVHPWVKTLDLNNSVISITDECVTDIALQETSLKLHDIGSVLNN
jgi:type I restriction enzyme S subunit